MQTFLPYADFKLSASVLDKKRAWKQVVETKQILCILRAQYLPLGWASSNSYKNQPFKNHPAVLMWRGHEEVLKRYYNEFLDHCITVLKIKTELKPIPFIHNAEEPFWLGNEDFHRSHRARLIEKDKSFYSVVFPEDEGFNKGKYFWPVMETKTFKLI